MLRAHHLSDTLDLGSAYRRPPRGTVVRRTSNPVLRGVHPYDDFPTSRPEPYYRDRRSYGLAPKPTFELRETFEELKRAWLDATADASSTSDIVKHPAHLAIIGLGPDALPLILQDVAEGGGHWLWALRAIT